jgi:hypothetical protein
LAGQFGYNTNYDAKTGNITFTNESGLAKTLNKGQYAMMNDSASLPMSKALALFGGSFGYDNQMVKNGGYGWQYGVEPKREDYKTLQEFYDADNKYIQSLLENPNLLPSAVGNYQLTLPTAGISRSTDVYGRIIDGNSIKWLGRDGSQLWSTFAPNTNWHQTGSGSDDKELGDAYSRNLSRFASQTIFKRGDNIGQTPSTLDGVSYDGGKAYQQYQDDLVNKYSKLQMRNPWAQALKGNDQGNNVQTAKAVATQVNSPATAQTAVTETAPATLASQKAVQQAVQQPQTVYTTNANALKDIGIRDFGNAYGYDVGWNGTSPYLTKNGQVFNFGQNDFTTKDGRSYMSGDMADLLLGNGNTSYL